MLIFEKRTKGARAASSLLALMLLVAPFVVRASGVVPCATKENPQACTLCDLVIGVYNVMAWGVRVAVIVGIFSITVAGILYIVSAGNTKLTEMAKDAMKNVAIGVLVMLGAWLIVNNSMALLGVNDDLASNWWDFQHNFTCN